jgi:aminoglycoside phosphotransferase (APT) family kinase protein
VKPEADPPGLRLEALRAWLSVKVPGVDAKGPMQARLMTGGRSNVTYELQDAAGRRLALRRPPLGHVLPSAHDMRREYTVMSGLASVGFPVPSMLAFCDDAEVIGSPFLLMEFVDGRVIADALDSAALSPNEAAAISAELIDVLARLHSIDAAQAGLVTLGRPDGYLERQVQRWFRQWSLTKTRELVDVDWLQARLARAVGGLPTGQPWSIVHGDFRIDNVILAAAEPRVSAVVDWEMATLGDPLMDLAIMLVYWSEAGDGLRSFVPVAQGVTSGAGFWTREQCIDAYVKRTGQDTGHLDFCVALACFKLAVIMESIHFRQRSGQQVGASAEHEEDMGRATELLAEMGRKSIDGGGMAGLHA